MTTEQAGAPAGGERVTDGLGTPALVLGVVAVGTVFPVVWLEAASGLAWLGVVLGLAGAVVGFIGTKRAFHDTQRSGGLALTGLVLGLVGFVWGLAVVLPGLLGTGTFGEGLSLDQCMQQAPNQQLQRICATQHLDEYRTRFPGRQNI